MSALMVSLRSEAAITKGADIGTGSVANGTTLTISVVSSGVSVGSRIFVSWAAASSGVGLVGGAGADNRGNTYALDGSFGLNNMSGGVCSSTVATAVQPGDTITLTLTAAASAVATASVFAGLDTNGPDMIGINSGTGSSAAATLAGTTGQANELVLALVATTGSGTGITAGAPYGTLPVASVGLGGGAFLTLQAQYQVVNGVATYGATAAISQSQPWVMSLWTFRDVVAPVELQRLTAE